MCLRFVGVLTFVALITSVTSTTSKAEYDFSWLDPDKKIYVIQNRKYLKAKRALVSVLGGLGLSNPYRTTYNVSAVSYTHLTLPTITGV